MRSLRVVKGTAFGFGLKCFGLYIYIYKKKKFLKVKSLVEVLAFGAYVLES